MTQMKVRSTKLVMYAKITKWIGAVCMIHKHSSHLICVVYAVGVVLNPQDAKILVMEKQIILAMIALLILRHLGVDCMTQLLSLREKCAVFAEVVRVVIQ